MGQQYKENYKRATGRAPGAADSPDDLLRVEDGLASISGSIIGDGFTTVVANAVGDLVISSSGDGAGTLAAISGDIVGAGGTTVVANGANELEIASAAASAYDHTDIDENFEFRSDHRIHFSNSAANTDTLDTGIGRDGVGVVKVTDGSSGFGSLNVAGVQIGGAARFTTSAEPSVASTDWKLWSDGSAGIPQWKNDAGVIRSAVGVTRAHTNTVSSGNVGSGEQTIMTFTLPADSLDSDGAGVDVKAWGTWGTNSGSRNVQARFDGYELCRATVPDGTANNRSWEINVSAIRINSTTVEIVGRAEAFANTSNTYILRQRSGFSDLSSNSFPIEIVCENAADSANDEIVVHSMTVTLIPSI